MPDLTDGPVVRLDADRVLHLGWGEPDWFGPAKPIGAAAHSEAANGAGTTIEVTDDPLVSVLTMRATGPLDDLATGAFDQVSTGWNFRPQDRPAGSAPDALAAIGFQYTEFALPVRASADLAIWTLMPWRPAVVEPLVALAPDGRCLLLGPLDTYFDQIITVPVPDDLERGLTWGWHGDLRSVPEGFSSRLAVVGGHGVRDTIARYTALIAARHPTRRPAVDADSLGRSLSYWTDNGAAYWYRTEGDRDTTTTLADTVSDLRDRHIPVAAVQLDSWFYPHEELRPFDTDDWIVPPTGLIEWEPRPDVLPDGVAALATALGDPPLVTHCRHLSSASPLLQQFACWLDADRAHPEGVDLYEHWLDRARSWGVETFEHDWLIECFLGVRGLREESGRAEAWQVGLDEAAAARDMTLQWCMASPADLLHAVSLARVTSIRTSGDHGYLVGPGFLWNWFLLVNALARGLGLRPFKDVFWSDRTDPERHSEVESLLAALSTGPVGLGDRLGRAERELVLRTCLADGTIVRPDVAVAALDASFAYDAVGTPTALTGECWTDHPAGRWSYVVAINAGDHLAPDGSGAIPAIDATIRSDDLGESSQAGRCVAWDWRHGTATVLEPGATWSVRLGHLDWDLRILAPLSPDGLAVIGDPTRYATAGTARIAAITFGPGSVRVEVRGDGEAARIVGWSELPPTCDRPIEWLDGIWTIDLDANEVALGETLTIDVHAPNREGPK